MGNIHKTPYAPLGSAIRAMRLRAKESVAEVSSAIEIKEDRYAQFESGEIRPTEDVLELIISHFSLNDREADALWDLAGYDKKNEASHSTSEDSGSQTIMVMPFDARIVYTDMVHVMVNNFGVVMNFMQGAGPNNQPLAVARIGMSREHAESVLEILQKTLHTQQANEQPKQLKAPESPESV